MNKNIVELDLIREFDLFIYDFFIFNLEKKIIVVKYKVQ